jgi:integrase
VIDAQKPIRFGRGAKARHRETDHERQAPRREHAARRTAGMIEARIRFGAAGRKKFRVETEARKVALQEMARLLTGANVDPGFAIKLVGDAAQASDAEFEKLKRVAAVAAEPTSNVVKPAPVKAGSPGETVAAYAERWFDEREKRGLSSVEGDRGRFKLHINPTIGAKPIVGVSANDVRALVEVLDANVRAHDGMHWQSAKKMWGLVTKLFDDACESKTAALRVRADNPTRGVRGPDAGEPTAKQWLYPVEVSALLACDQIPLRWRRLYALATYLYLRTGELAALEWADVDSVRGFVNVHQALDLATGKLKSTKTGVTRKVPIHPSLAPLLAVLRAESGGVGLVVQNPHEQRTQPHGLPPKERLATSLREHLQLKAKVDRAELYADRATTKRITFYDLRATGITWEVLAGTEHVRVQQRAGHKHFATTALYIREAETLGVAVGEPFPPLPASLLGQSEGPGPSDPQGPSAGPTPGPMVTEVTGTKGESSEAHRLFEALRVREHVHVGKHVGG